MMMSGKDFLKSHVLSWRQKVNSDWEGQGIPGLWASNSESKATDARLLITSLGLPLNRWHQKMIGACRTKLPSESRQ